MQHELVDLLQHLADKIGVTLTALWSDVTQYVVAAAITQSVASVVITALLWVCTIKLKNADCRSDQEQAQEVAVLFVGGLCAVMVLLTILVIGQNIAAIWNPAGYLVREILRNQ